MRRIPLAGMLAAVAAAQGPSPVPARVPATLVEEMTRADGAFVQAAGNGDIRALGKLLDADFTWTDSEGKTQTKAGVLRELPKRAIADERDAAVRQYTYGDMGDVEVDFGRDHVLRVWVKRAGGWKAMVYQEVRSLDAPPSFAPGAGRDCENPCRRVGYEPKNPIEREVIAAYSKLETAAMGHNSAEFATLVADEFVAASSNSNKLSDKRGRMEDFDHAKNAGVAPTPLTSAQMFDFSGAVLMRSEHTPDRGKPLHVTRVWVKREARWIETLSYQTSVAAADGILGGR